MKTISEIYNEQLNKFPADRTLLTVVDSRQQSAAYTMPELDAMASRAANCLRTAGCEKGDRVLISAHQTLSIWAFFWGALKNGAVPCVLFPGLGPGGLEIRLAAAKTCFLVTDQSSAALRGTVHFPDSMKKIILLEQEAPDDGFLKYQEKEWPETFPSASMADQDDAFIVFTSGTTGTPKPVVHRQGIAEAITRSMREVLRAEPTDVYWCTAHPAWITGTVYGILGPVLCGIPSVQYEGSFHAKRWMPLLQEQRISLWYTAPTALRGLTRENEDFFKDFDFSALRLVFSIGEPLSAPLFEWGEKTFGLPIYDTWFQTETGTIRIANQPGESILPGWMGKPVDDTDLIDAESGQTVPLRLKSGFDSMFKEYYGMPEETAARFQNGCYETGDLVTVNREGLVHFEGRADDVINTSGHLVSPMEVEAVLMAHPDVLEAAVVAEPDDLVYEQVAAYLVLADHAEWSRRLESELRVAVNKGVSSYAIPKKFYITDVLPHTLSGKINRKQLKK